MAAENGSSAATIFNGRLLIFTMWLLRYVVYLVSIVPPTKRWRADGGQLLYVYWVFFLFLGIARRRQHRTSFMGRWCIPSLCNKRQ